MLNAVPLPLISADPSESKGSARSISIAPERNFAAPANPNAGKSGKIVLPTMEGFCFEKIKHIAYLEANGNYTTLHFTDKRQILVCKTLREVELLLPEPAFARIHRSHTIHLKHLKKYIRGKGGHVVLQNGSTLVVSAGQKELFLDSLKSYFG
ncbi:MAG: LytTR family DNA-binding domain-containing protein [Saprospiraceae bacterium]